MDHAVVDKSAAEAPSLYSPHVKLHDFCSGFYEPENISPFMVFYFKLGIMYYSPGKVHFIHCAEPNKSAL